MATRNDSFNGLVGKLERGGKSAHYAKAIAGKVAKEKGDIGKRKDAQPRLDDLDPGRIKHDLDKDKHEDADRAVTKSIERHAHKREDADMADVSEIRKRLDGMMSEIKDICAELDGGEREDADESEEHEAGEELAAGRKEAKEGEEHEGDEKEHEGGEELAEDREDADGSPPPIQPHGHGGRHRKDAEDEEERHEGAEKAHRTERERGDAEDEEERSEASERGHEDEDEKKDEDDRGDRSPADIAEGVVEADAAREDNQQIGGTMNRSDQEIRRTISLLEAKLARATRAPTYAERDQLAQIQVRCDSVSQALGLRPEPPTVGELPGEYRRRCASLLQPFCERAKGVNLSRLSDRAFGLIEDRIYADAQAATKSPGEALAGQLIPVQSHDAAGRTITRYYGDPNVWMKPFKARGLHVRFADSVERRGAR